MLISSLLLGLALGYLIQPAQRAYANYDWYRTFRKYGRRRSFKIAFKDIWG